jgi:hypothetical protein
LQPLGKKSMLVCKRLVSLALQTDAQGTIFEQMLLPVRYGAPAGACNAFNREFFESDSLSSSSGFSQMLTGFSVSSTSLQYLREGTCFTLCVEGTYEISSPLSCLICPGYSKSDANSQSISDCKCQLGSQGKMHLCIQHVPLASSRTALATLFATTVLLVSTRQLQKQAHASTASPARILRLRALLSARLAQRNLVLQVEVVS